MTDAAKTLTELDGILTDLETFGDNAQNSHNKRAYVRRQARRARDKLVELAAAVGVKVEGVGE